jgi:hypothetical protein
MSTSEQVPEGSGKQYGEDVADVREHSQTDRDEPGSGRQFARDVSDPVTDPSAEVPAGSGKQFAPGVEGDPNLGPPEAGKGFATGTPGVDVHEHTHEHDDDVHSHEHRHDGDHSHDHDGPHLR